MEQNIYKYDKNPYLLIIPLLGFPIRNSGGMSCWSNKEKSRVASHLSEWEEPHEVSSLASQIVFQSINEDLGISGFDS